MFYEEKRTKQDLSYISICSLSDNSKFLLTATSLGTNAVFVTRVRCTKICILLPADEEMFDDCLDQLRSAVSALGLDCLLRPGFLNTKAKYGTSNCNQRW